MTPNRTDHALVAPIYGELTNQAVKNFRRQGLMGETAAMRQRRLEKKMNLHSHLKKRLGAFHLDLELSCRQGETVCIVGASGSGKTTLLRLLAGLDRPDAGFIRMGREVWFDGNKSIFMPPQRRSAGLAFQEYHLFPHMTLWQNVAYAAADNAVILKLLNAFGIAHLKDRTPSRISGGERQRGALCQALARKPRLLLLDEPFSALDLETRLGLRRVLKQIQRENPLCMIHVTHDLSEALFLGDRILAMQHGKNAPRWLGRQLDLLRQEQAIVSTNVPDKEQSFLKTEYPNNEGRLSYA